jgi:hypothetical protein
MFVALVIQHANARAPYSHLWPAQLYNIFPRYFLIVMSFLKKVTVHKMCLLIFSTTFVWNISHSKKNWARYGIKCVQVLMYNTSYSSQILMKLEFYLHILENYSNIILHENSSSEIRVVLCGRMDRLDEFNSRFSQGRDSSVDIATRYGLGVSGIESQAGKMGRDFPHPSRPAPGAHPASYASGTASFPEGRGVKEPVRGVDHPPTI